MTARRKRAALSRASKRDKSKSMKKEYRSNQGQDVVSVETYRAKPTWKIKRVCSKNQDESDLNLNDLLQFHNAGQVADWIFQAAKHHSMKLTLNCLEQNEDVRDALLRQFHRWPEVKVLQATTRCQNLSQEAQHRCHEQVQMYLHELRNKLLAGAKALFWLDELQPFIHPPTMPRVEAQGALMAFVDEIKSIDGLYEELTRENARLWAVLTLPLKLEPLFQGVSILALNGFKFAAYEAMQMLTIFAENSTSFNVRGCREPPLGLRVVASIRALTSSDSSDLTVLDKSYREIFSRPLAMMVHDWIWVIEQVLILLEKVLTDKWTSCERALYEEELKISMQSYLQSAFEQLNYNLSAGQLYAMRKIVGERSNVDKKVLNVNILHDEGWLRLIIS